VIQGNMFNPRQSYRKPSGQQMGLTSMFYPAGSPQPNLQTSTRRPSMPNPIAPAAVEARANAQFMQANPGYGTSSLDATQRAGSMTMYNPFQASMVNGYVGQYGQAAAPGRPGAQGPTVFDPTNLAARFGGAPAVSQASLDANARMARTQASDALLAGKLASGQTIDPTAQSGAYAKRTADGGMAYTNKAGAVEGIYPGLRNPMKRSQALEKLQAENPNLYAAYQADQGQRADKAAMTANRVQKFKDEHGGMSARQFGIQSRQSKREQARFKRDVMRGMNPMSPEAAALHPEAYKSFQQNMGKKSEASTMQNPMAIDKPRTAENFQAAQDALTLRVSGVPASDVHPGYQPDPFLTQTIGLTPDDMSPTAAQAGLFAATQAGSVDIPPADIRKLQEVARTAKKKPGDEDPFVFHSVWNSTSPAQTSDFGPLWKELHDIPDNAPDAKLSEWYDRYKAIVRSKYGGK